MILERLAEGDKKGMHRIQFLIAPSAAQMSAIPFGSDVIVYPIGGDEGIAYGPWSEGTRDVALHHIEADGCDHYHAMVAYLPPVPAPESTLTAEAIADDIMDGMSASRDSRGTFTLDSRRLAYMLQAAVHQAREGMVYPPF